MGYTTEFQGELEFTNELTATQLAEVKKFLGEDCREHPEWDSDGMTWIDLEFTDDFSGLQWDGGEKTYDLVEKVNMIIRIMNEKHSNFGLKGELLAQGEEMGDIWKLKIEGGIAVEVRETEEDVKLKDAAPELLEALIELEKAVYNISMPSDLMNRVEQAIKKATS